MKIWIFHPAFLLFLLQSGNVFSAEVEEQQILQRFELIPESPCKKIAANEPPPPLDAFWYERNYLSVDGSRYCQIHQFAIFWMSKTATDNRKYTESKLYRFHAGKWIAEHGLDYIPKLRIRSKSSGRVYLVVDRNSDEFPVKQIAYFTGSWKRTSSHPQEYGIQTVWATWSQSDVCGMEDSVVSLAVELLQPKPILQ